MAADKTLKDLTNAVYKIAENSPKIQKDVKDIKDAICGTDGILEILYSFEKTVSNHYKKESALRLLNKRGPNMNDRHQRELIKSTSSISKILNKILNKIPKSSGRGNIADSDRRRLNIDRTDRTLSKKNQRLEGISRSVEIIERLKYLKLKDFIFAKKKLKNIGNIISQGRNIFKKFKNQKEVDGTLHLVEASIDIVKKLSKIWLISKPAQLSIKAIEKIFLGGKKPGGLLGLFKKIDKNSPVINRGVKTMKNILAACGSFLLTSMVLVGIAALSIPAMLGALLMKGVVMLMIGTFKLLNRARKSVIKGSLVMLIMSASVITFSLGLSLMAKTVKDIKLKDVGLMVLSIAGMGLAVAGVGLAAIPIAIGSGMLILLSASLGIFALSIMAWQKIDTKTAMGNIKEAIGGIREVFGLELGNGDEGKNMFERIGGGVLDIAMGVLNFGKTFFVMGSLLLAGFALRLLYQGLKNWQNFTGGKRAAENIRVAVGALKEAFGLEDNPKDNLVTKLGKLGGSVLDTGISLLQSGKVLAQMGTITIATAMMDIIRVTLTPWEKYNAKPAAENIKTAFATLKDAFGLEDRNGETVKGKLSGSASDLFGLASSIFQMGSTFAKMGTLILATAMMDVIKLHLTPWDNYNPSDAVGNIKTAMFGLTEAFGLEDNSKTVSSSITRGIASLFDLGSNLLQKGNTFTKMGTLLIATGAMNTIKENLVAWDEYNPSQSISNIQKAITGLTDIFGLKDTVKEQENEGKGGFLGKVSGLFKRAAEVITAPAKMVGDLVDAASGLTEGGKMYAKLSNLIGGSAMMLSVKNSIEPWNEFNPTQAINNIHYAISGLYNELFASDQTQGLGFYANVFRKTSHNINIGLNSIKMGLMGSSIFKMAVPPLKTSVSAINSLDLDKASTMIELFKSFTKIGVKPFDKFTTAVEKFSESCTDLIKSLDRFGNTTEEETTETTNEDRTSTNTSVVSSDHKALAQAIADALRAMPINVETNLSDVRLVVNNEAGRRVVLTLEN